MSASPPPTVAKKEELVWAINECICTEKQVRFSFVVVLFIIGFVLFTLIFYYRTTKLVKEWVTEKRNLKLLAKRLAKETATKLSTPHDFESPRSINEDTNSSGVTPLAPAVTDQSTPQQNFYDYGASPNYDPLYYNIPEEEKLESPSEWLERLEATKVGSKRNGFVFLIDSDANVWAHGQAQHLAKDGTKRLPGFYNVKDLDEPYATNASPISSILRAGKKGGGYVHFRWKKNKLMMGYVCPVPKMNLILGVTIPIPKSQTVWEEASWWTKITKKPLVKGKLF